jgi:hypothetical protein
VLLLRGAGAGAALSGGAESFAISLGAIAVVDVIHDVTISAMAESKAQSIWHQRIHNCQSLFNQR